MCGPARRLSDAILLTTSPLLMKPKDRAAFGRVEEKVRLSRYGGDCYAYCMLAAGHVDLVIETELNPFDIIALIPVVDRRGRRHHVLGRRTRDSRRPHHRRRRRARAQGGDGSAARLICPVKQPRKCHRPR